MISVDQKSRHGESNAPTEVDASSINRGQQTRLRKPQDGQQWRNEPR